MSVVINEMDVVPAEPAPEGAAPTPAGTPSAAETERLVEQVARMRLARARRLRAD